MARGLHRREDGRESQLVTKDESLSACPEGSLLIERSAGVVVGGAGNAQRQLFCLQPSDKRSEAKAFGLAPSILSAARHLCAPKAYDGGLFVLAHPPRHEEGGAEPRLYAAHWSDLPLDANRASAGAHV